MDQDRARSLLTAERDEVRSLLKDSEAAGQADRVAEVESEAEDNADAALALTEEGEDDALAESLRDRLDAIERALHRLDDGTYGRSIRSGQPIPGGGPGRGHRRRVDPRRRTDPGRAPGSRPRRRTHRRGSPRRRARLSPLEHSPRT